MSDKMRVSLLTLAKSIITAVVVFVSAVLSDKLGGDTVAIASTAGVLCSSLV